MGSIAFTFYYNGTNIMSNNSINERFKLIIVYHIIYRSNVMFAYCVVRQSGYIRLEFGVRWVLYYVTYTNVHVYRIRIFCIVKSI